MFALTSDNALRAKDVAALFVSVTDHWYSDPGNALFRKRSEAYNLILNYLETGEIHNDMPYYMAYVIGKFREEWFDFDRPTKLGSMVVRP